MLDQNSKEFLYFKVPVFITDLAIHLGILTVLMRTMEESYLMGEVSYIGFRIYALLAIAFSYAISVEGLRLHERKIKPSVVVWRAIKQTVLTYIGFVVLLALVYKTTPRYLIFAQVGVTLVVVAIWHWLCNKIVRMVRKSGFNTKHVLVIGGGKIATRLCKELGYGQAISGYKVIGYFAPANDEVVSEKLEYLGNMKEFFDMTKTIHPDEIYCTLPPETYKTEVDKIIKICNDNFIEFFFVPTMEGYPKRHMVITTLGKVNMIKLREEPMNTLKCKISKRTFDIVVSLLFLCTIYPFVCLFVWLGDILTGSKGPLYFRQERTGYNGKGFKVYKFRSMKVNSDADKVQATKDDPRKTKFGNFLRKSSIDELPQFINVLKGDMSLIGPRPHMLYHTEMYSQLIGNYMVRHLCRPGITGWAQVNGCRGETKTVEDMEKRVEHDIWYIEHWTPLLDIVVFFKTIIQLMPGRDKQAY
ncbi:MAG: undecaprenyl-phosphate glucose phosphotransferase [Prevotellaceae bacterium]|nr:undecaprenyl-phosphate glucose phosphotransferase [Prevotellaceae bacterium]